MFDIKQLSRKEKIELLHALEKSLGWHSVATLCVDDLKDYFIETLEETPPSNEHLKQACAYVARRSDEDVSHLLEWAAEVAKENVDVQ